MVIVDLQLGAQTFPWELCPPPPHAGYGFGVFSGTTREYYLGEWLWKSEQRNGKRGGGGEFIPLIIWLNDVLFKLIFSNFILLCVIQLMYLFRITLNYIIDTLNLTGGHLFSLTLSLCLSVGKQHTVGITMGIAIA